MLAIRLWNLPLSSIIYVQQIYWECRRRRFGLCPKCRGALPSEPVSQYRCMTLPKTDDNNRIHIVMMQTPYLDIWPMLLSGQVPRRMSNSSHLFWNLEYPCASSNTVL